MKGTDHSALKPLAGDRSVDGQEASIKSRARPIALHCEMSRLAIGEHGDALRAGKAQGRCHVELSHWLGNAIGLRPKESEFGLLVLISADREVRDTIPAGTSVMVFPSAVNSASAKAPRASLTPTTISRGSNRVQRLAERQLGTPVRSKAHRTSNPP
jgi:hypothetical protein